MKVIIIYVYHCPRMQKKKKKNGLKLSPSSTLVNCPQCLLSSEMHFSNIPRITGSHSEYVLLNDVDSVDDRRKRIGRLWDVFSFAGCTAYRENSTVVFQLPRFAFVHCGWWPTKREKRRTSCCNLQINKEKLFSYRVTNQAVSVR